MADAVFQVVDTLAIGGAERMTVDVSNGLAARDWNVHLFATRALGPLADEVDEEVAVHDLARKSRWDLDGIREFRKAVATERPQVVHTHGWSSLQFATAALIGLRKAPALVFHDHRGKGFPPIGPSYRASAWPLTQAHVAVDRSLLSPRLRTRRRAVRTVVPNGVPLDRFATKTTYEITGPMRLVIVANLRPEKNHLGLLDSIAMLGSHGVDTRIDLIGTIENASYRASCDALVDDLGLSDRVTMLGPRQDLATLLAGYDVGVLSSRTESGPVALIEYLAAGLPFVVTDVGEVPASLPEGLRQWVVPPGDPGCLADRIRDVLSLSPEARREIARVGAAFARNHFSIERALDSIEDVYHQISR